MLLYLGGSVQQADYQGLSCLLFNAVFQNDRLYEFSLKLVGRRNVILSETLYPFSDVFQQV